ncbi:MAG: PEGA domain-containing protein [Myxococcota bacterium]|nr:PEGA domain-containing protein [Myxococcota bacterium]
MLGVSMTCHGLLRRRLVPLVVLLGCTVIAASSPARADVNAEARLYFERGNETLAQALRARGTRRRALLEEALASFVQSLRIVRSRNAVFNAGVTLEALDRPTEAFNYYSEYLAMPDLSEDERIEGSRRREALRPRVAVAAVETEPPGAEVRVDRLDLAPVGRTPLEVALPEGERTFFFAAPDHQPAQQSARLAVGARVQVRVRLEPIPRPVEPEPEPPPQPESPTPPQPATLRVSANVPFRIAVDGHWYNATELDPGPDGLAIRIRPGHRTVTVTARGYGEARTSLDAEAGRTLYLEATLRPLRRDETRHGGWPTAGWVATGVSGLVATVLGIRAIVLNDDFAERAQRGDDSREALEALADDVESANLVADVFWGLTAALGATSLWLTLTDDRLEPEPSVLRIGVGPLDGGALVAARGQWGSP